MGEREVTFIIPDLKCVRCLRTEPGTLDGMYSDNYGAMWATLKVPEQRWIRLTNNVMAPANGPSGVHHHCYVMCMECHTQGVGSTRQRLKQET